MSRPVAGLLFGIVFHPTIARREGKTANWRWRILFGHLKSQRSSKRQAKEKITFLIRLSSLPLIMTDSSRNRLWLNQKSCAEMPSHASADWLWCARRLINFYRARYYSSHSLNVETLVAVLRFFWDASSQPRLPSLTQTHLRCQKLVSTQNQLKLRPAHQKVFFCDSLFWLDCFLHKAK